MLVSLSLPAIIQLQSAILKLKAQRQEYEKAIAEIDQVFEQLKIKIGVKRGRKPGSKNKMPSSDQMRSARARCIKAPIIRDGVFYVIPGTEFRPDNTLRALLKEIRQC